MLAVVLPTLDGLGKIFVYLFMLSTLIVLHEFGHFVLARRFGVKVNAFAVGMGPKLLGWTSARSGTSYQLNLLPVGGYCRLQTDRHASDVTAAGQGDAQVDNSFAGKRAVQRLAIIGIAPIVNLVLAFGLFVGSYSIFGMPSPTTTIGSIQPGMPAAAAGLLQGDRVIAVNGVAVTAGTAFLGVIERSIGKPVDVRITRGEGALRQVRTVIVRPVRSAQGYGIIGFVITEKAVRMSMGDAVRRAGNDFLTGWTGTFAGLASAFRSFAHLPHAASDDGGDLHGVIGIGSIAGAIQDAGVGAYLNFAAAMSLSLGIFNLLPIPGLDGGRAAFILIEIVRGKPVDRSKEAYVHAGGFAFLLLLMLVVSYHDVVAIFAGKGAL